MSTPSPGTVWREPTSLLPLNWGTYRGRYLGGLTLIVGGAFQLNGSNVWTLQFLLIGAAAHALGWIILPARGWRRSLSAIAATGATVALLVGPRAMPVFALLLVCWLLVRHRPALSYITLLLPLASGLVVSQVLTEYSGMPIALGISIVVLVGSAWLARVLAASRAIAEGRRTSSQSQA